MLMVQASFNALKTLPAAMGELPRLELMRVAVNCIEQVVPQLLFLCKQHLHTIAKWQAKLQQREDRLMLPLQHTDMLVAYT